MRSSYTYDERNNIKNLYVVKDNVVLADNEYTYKEDGLVDSFTMPLMNNAVQTNSYDSLNRITQESVLSPYSDMLPVDIVVDTNYTYVSNGSNETGLVARKQYSTIILKKIDKSTPKNYSSFKYQVSQVIPNISPSQVKNMLHIVNKSVNKVLNIVGFINSVTLNVIQEQMR